MEETKLKCSYCQGFLSVDKFAKASTTKRGYNYGCKACNLARRDTPELKEKAVGTAKKWRHANWEQHKDTFLRKTYGISYDAYQHMKEKQDSECAICYTKEEDSPKGLVVDHCHETGKVRRLLCGQCNTGLGMFKDNPQLLRTAAEYLEDQWIATMW